MSDEGRTATEAVSNNRRQTILSMIILSILVIIGAGVFYTQFHFNPAVLQKDALLPTPNKNMPGSVSKLAPYDAFAPLPEGLAPLTAAETFNASNLSDKINGKAELYLVSGFTRLVTQRFRDERVADLWLEVFVYDMGSSQNAFSVFSAQRRQDGQPLDLAPYAYTTSNSLFLAHGRNYVEIIAAMVSDQASASMIGLAETFMRNTPAERAAVGETDRFPEKGLVKESIVLIASDAFGYEGFDKIYTAEYEAGDHRLMAYLSRRESPEKAAALASAYGDFLMAYGGKEIAVPPSIKGARVVEILDTYEIVFSHGAYVGGIRDAADVDQATSLATQLYGRIKEGQ